MKSLFRSIVVFLLGHATRAIIRKYRPRIVMVTGSVGKTSTKDAIAAALGQEIYLRASEKSYNSEFGVPLTVIGAKNAWTSLLGWLRVFRQALGLILLPSHYPKLLVLEVGADRPGDLERILRFAVPDAVVVTRLPEVPVHVEAYATPQALRDEEFLPALALPAGAPLVVSSRDAHAMEMAKRTHAEVCAVGFREGADVHIGEPWLAYEDGFPAGMKAEITASGISYVLRAPGVLGRPQILAPAMAFATALALGVAPEGALRGLASYQPPPGRGRILRGRKGAILIDESYNASPVAVEEALEALALLGGKPRRIAVLGDMLELGRYSVEEHERIGELAAGKADLLITVGVRARAIREAALKAGMSELQALACADASEAASVLMELAGEGDAVLVKGSQSIRTERIVEALLADPGDARLLPRQDPEWKKR